MPSLLIVNESDETIEVEPGGSTDPFGEEGILRGPVCRHNKFTVEQPRQP